MWRAILDDTREAWQAAYEHRPTRLSAALDQAHGVLEARTDVELGPEVVRLAAAPPPLPTSARPRKVAPGYEAPPFAGRSKVAA
jgi:hypothetical protein